MANRVRLESSFVPGGFLGGLPPESMSNKIPAESIYGSLPRRAPSSLPRAHSGCRKFHTNELKDAFLKIYGGDFTLEWEEEDGQDNEKVLTLVACLNDSGDDDATEHFRGVLIGTKITASPNRFNLAILSSETSCGRLFYRNLTQNQREALTDRVLHHFLRARASHLHETLCRALIHCLRPHYVERCYWKESVDLNMIAADVALNTSYGGKSIIMDLVRVGEALEADGRFQEAATLYEEISGKFWGKFADKSYDQAFLHHFAALAYKSAHCFEDSERFFVTALHHTRSRTGGSWVSDSRTEEVFGNMIAMYIQLQVKECCDRGVTEVDATIEVALGSLACSAGIGSDYIKEYETVSLLKPKYQKKKTAQKKLAVAVSSPVSVEKFRKEILGCAAHKMDRIHTSSEIDTCDRRRRRDKKTARELNATVHNKDKSTWTFKCSNPDCQNLDGEGTCMFCPCKTVCYCQKACQKSHWKEHKKVCHKQNGLS